MSSNNRNRRSTGGVSMAVGAAFAAALIGVANPPAATADPGVGEPDVGATVVIDQPDPLPDAFQELFGNTGFNSWTTAADSFLNSSDPTLAASLDTSVDNFQTTIFGNPVLPSSGDTPFEWLVNNGLGLQAFSDGFPTNALGDLATGLDYTLFASGLGPTLDPALYNLFEWTASIPILLCPVCILGGA